MQIMLSALSLKVFQLILKIISFSASFCINMYQLYIVAVLKYILATAVNDLHSSIIIQQITNIY